MIYVIHASGTRFVKIGKADNPLKRIGELQVGCPHELCILAMADWCDDLEISIHRVLVNDWVRGEWFEMSDNVSILVNTIHNNGTYSTWIDSIHEISDVKIPKRLINILSIHK